MVRLRGRRLGGLRGDGVVWVCGTWGARVLKSRIGGIYLRR